MGGGKQSFSYAYVVNIGLQLYTLTQTLNILKAIIQYSPIHVYIPTNYDVNANKLVKLLYDENAHYMFIFPNVFKSKYKLTQYKYISMYKYILKSTHIYVCVNTYPHIDLHM